MRVNNSSGEDYYSQRNNKIRPLEACATTSMIMALLYSGIKLPKCTGQPEDALINFLETDERVIKFYKENSITWIRNSYTNKIPPNEIHDVLRFGTNTFIGRKVDTFKLKVSIQTIILHLMSGLCCVVSGRWPYKDSTGKIKLIDHVVCLVGFVSENDTISNIGVNDITHFIIDDPFGDYRTKYESSKGNNIEVPYTDFIKIIKPQGSEFKFCHLIKEV